MYSKSCVKRPLSKIPHIGFQDQLSLNAGQKHCRKLQGEHSAILSTFIKLPFVIKIFVLSIFEWPFYTGFTKVLLYIEDCLVITSLTLCILETPKWVIWQTVKLTLYFFDIPRYVHWNIPSLLYRTWRKNLVWVCTILPMSHKGTLGLNG